MKKNEHGGKRAGAGRPSNKGPWGEKTVTCRIPTSMQAEIGKYLVTRGYKLPLFSSNVPAGSPGLISDHIDKMTDLNSLLLNDPEQSFLLNVSGDSMEGAGIFDGDILVVSKKKKAVSGKIVVALVNDSVTVKRLRIDSKGTHLVPENKNYKAITISKTDNFIISGVVTGSVRKY